MEQRQEQLLSLCWGAVLHCSARCPCSSGSASAQQTKFVKLSLMFGFWAPVVHLAGFPGHAEIKGARSRVKDNTDINIKL